MTGSQPKSGLESRVEQVGHSAEPTQARPSVGALGRGPCDKWAPRCRGHASGPLRGQPIAAFTLSFSLLAVEIFQDFLRSFLWCFLSFLLGSFASRFQPQPGAVPGRAAGAAWLTTAPTGPAPSASLQEGSPSALVLGSSSFLSLEKN